MSSEELVLKTQERCSFPLGYIRQPIYACKTCSEESDANREPAGICHSCSITCHATHELFELFPKRNFRCDCGLPGKTACMLMIPAKKIIKKNDKNKYNHNFQGQYCRCNNEYDPGKEEHVMYQCIACEDWFHQYCIGNIPEEIQDFECYVCRLCTKKYPFLLNGKDTRFSFGLSNKDTQIHEWIIPTYTSARVTDKHVGEKRKAVESTTLPNKKQKCETLCQNVNVASLPKHDHIELFLQESWRDGLCKCTQCLKNYEAYHVNYLLAEEKTYEPEEDEKERSLLDIGFEELGRIDRVKVIESLQVHTSLANNIKSFLESHEKSGKIITQQELEAFFDINREEKKH